MVSRILLRWNHSHRRMQMMLYSAQVFLVLTDLYHSVLKSLAMKYFISLVHMKRLFPFFQFHLLSSPHYTLPCCAYISFLSFHFVFSPLLIVTIFYKVSFLSFHFVFSPPLILTIPYPAVHTFLSFL